MDVWGEVIKLTAQSISFTSRQIAAKEVAKRDDPQVTIVDELLRSMHDDQREE